MSQGAGTRRVAGEGRRAPLFPPVGQHGRAAGSAWRAPRSPGQAPGERRLEAMGRRVHMIGVGGCGMSGAAAVLRRRGAIVSGSDRASSAALLRLAEQGVHIRTGQCAENLPEPCDLVVYSAAVPESNPELQAARRRGCRVIKYAELLGLLMADRRGIGVAGTHGKSTTSAMVTFVLREAGLDPSFVIGATVEQLGSGSGVGEGETFVVEACEYDRSFLNLRPRTAVILNIEEDHLDYYSGLEEIVESFSAFAALLPPDGLMLVNGEDRGAMRAAQNAAATVETFGFDGGTDWRAEITGSAHGRMRFNVHYRGQLLAEVMLAIPGRHNVANALAAAAVCYHHGVDPQVIARALGRFRGAHRRLTLRGQARGVCVVDDYAHHPTEIQATLRAARDFYTPARMFVVFQPHQHSRTRFLLNDFARSFAAADVVVVPDIYFVRDSAAERDLVSAIDLVRQIHLNGGEARYEPDFDRIVEMLCAEAAEGDLVVTMGAGDVWRIADRLVARLNGVDMPAEPPAPTC